jgi:hypothetical protein
MIHMQGVGGHKVGNMESGWGSIGRGEGDIEKRIIRRGPQ